MDKYISPSIWQDPLNLLIRLEATTALRWINVFPDWIPEIHKNIYTVPNPLPKDKADDAWAGLHSVYRKASSGLLERITEVSNQNPDNKELSFVVEVASDIYKACERERQNNFITEELKNKLRRSENAPYIERAKSIVPDLSTEEVGRLIRVARQVAGYSFAGKRGLIRLPNQKLHKALTEKNDIKFGTDAEKDFIVICEELGKLGVDYGLPTEFILTTMQKVMPFIRTVAMVEALSPEGNSIEDKTMDIIKVLKEIVPDSDPLNATRLMLVISALGNNLDTEQKARADEIVGQIKESVAQSNDASDTGALHAILTSQKYWDIVGELKKGIGSNTPPELAAEIKEMLALSCETPEIIRAAHNTTGKSR